MKKTTLIGLTVATLATSGHAVAEGYWQVQGGLTAVNPRVKSGSLTAPAPANTQADVGGDTQPTLQLNYQISPSFSVALPLGLGFRHEMVGAGAIDGVGVIGNVKALPVTVFGRYHFNPESRMARGYLAAGISYVHFSDANASATLSAINPINPPGGSTTISVDSKTAFSVGIGVQAPMDNGWYLDAFVGKMKLKTTTHLSTGQTMEARLDPVMVTFAFGRDF